MKAKQEDVVKLREKQLAKKDAESRLREKIKADKKKKDKMKVPVIVHVKIKVKIGFCLICIQQKVRHRYCSCWKTWYVEYPRFLLIYFGKEETV